MSGTYPPLTNADERRLKLDVLVTIVQPLELSEGISMHAFRNSTKGLHRIDHLFVPTRNSRQLAVPRRYTTLAFAPIRMLVGEDRKLIAATRLGAVFFYKLRHKLIEGGTQAVSNVADVDAPVDRRVAQDPNANGEHADLCHRVGVDLMSIAVPSPWV